MAGINKVILLGNLGRDPEVQNFENGVKKATFSLATSETYKNKDGNKTVQTEWHNIVLWRGLAEIAEKFLVKGKQVYLEGKIRTRTWEDKEGKKRYTTEIIADNILLLGSGREHTQGDMSSPHEEENMQYAENHPVPEDDLPF